MNADDAGAIRRSSRGSLDRSSPFFGTTIRFRPPHRRPFSRPFAVANAATTPTSACHANNRRPRRVLARSSRSSRVFVGVRGVGSIGFDRSGSILRSFPRADECRVPRKNASVVKSDGSTSIRDRRFSSLNMWWYFRVYASPVVLPGQFVLLCGTYSVLVLFIHTTRVFHRTRPRRLVSETSEND